MHILVVEALHIVTHLPEERAHTYRHREIQWAGWYSTIIFDLLVELLSHFD
jgi:hypothetical protein